MRSLRCFALTSKAMSDKLSPSNILPMGRAEMMKHLFLRSNVGDTMEQIVQLVNAGKLESGL